MKVFIAGASGVLGRRLVRQFVARGHSVIGQVRSAKAEIAVREAGGEPRHADLFDAESLARAAEGCDTVIHAATAIPIKQKTTPADWAMNDRIRRKGTRCLTEAAAKIGAKTYLQQSMAWVARPKMDSPFDEDSPIVPDPTIQSAIDAEAIAREAGSAEGFTVSILRGGYFYDSESAHTRMIADALRKRADAHHRPRRRGVGHDSHRRRRQRLCRRGGKTARAACGTSSTMNRFRCALSSRNLPRALGAPAPRRVPVWLARWLAGEQAVEFISHDPTRTTNARFRRDFESGRRAIPTYREGLARRFSCSAWKNEQFSSTDTYRARPALERD